MNYWYVAAKSLAVGTGICAFIGYITQYKIDSIKDKNTTKSLEKIDKNINKQFDENFTPDVILTQIKETYTSYIYHVENVGHLTAEVHFDFSSSLPGANVQKRVSELGKGKTVTFEIPKYLYYKDAVITSKHANKKEWLIKYNKAIANYRNGTAGIKDDIKIEYYWRKGKEKLKAVKYYMVLRSQKGRKLHFQKVEK
jgi:hypothetical protein